MGTAISYKVNDTTTQDFYVLKDNGATLTLISKDSVVSSVWDASGNNANGPRTATQALEDVTNDWINVVTNTYNGSTGIGTRARIITEAEERIVGCTNVAVSCSTWLTGSVDQWTATFNPTFSDSIWYIYDSNTRRLSTRRIDDSIGVHAIIDINK